MTWHSKSHFTLVFDRCHSQASCPLQHDTPAGGLFFRVFGCGRFDPLEWVIFLIDPLSPEYWHTAGGSGMSWHSTRVVNTYSSTVSAGTSSTMRNVYGPFMNSSRCSRHVNNPAPAPICYQPVRWLFLFGQRLTNGFSSTMSTRLSRVT